MEVLERLLAAKATVDAEDRHGRGAPELGTRPESCGKRRPDPKGLIPSHEGRVKHFMVQAGSFISSPEEQVSKMFELNERKELTGIVLGSHES